MTYEQIAALLDKYWEGEASLGEERLLKQYFAQDAVDARLRRYAPLFAALRAEKAVEYARPAQPARSLTVGWRRWAAAAAVVGLLAAAAWWALTRPAETDPTPVADAQPALPAPQKAAPPAPAAAPAPEGLANREDQPAARPRRVKPRPHPLRADQARQEAEAELAMQEIKAALALVSSKINKGKREAAKNLHQIETVDKILKSPGEG